MTRTTSAVGSGGRTARFGAVAGEAEEGQKKQGVTEHGTGSSSSSEAPPRQGFVGEQPRISVNFGSFPRRHRRRTRLRPLPAVKLDEAPERRFLEAVEDQRRAPARRGPARFEPGIGRHDQARAGAAAGRLGAAERIGTELGDELSCALDLGVAVGARVSNHDGPVFERVNPEAARDGGSVLAIRCPGAVMRAGRGRVGAVRELRARVRVGGPFACERALHGAALAAAIGVSES